jgi:hypothetical protein
MKTIEEEWKTIEEFPDYEISNLGRCRRQREKQTLKISEQTDCIYYSLLPPKKEGIKRVRKKRSLGKLIAKAFIPNPNGYKQIIYLDGDSKNAILTNIKWVDISSEIQKSRIISSEIRAISVKFKREEQLKKLRERIEQIERLEKALINGTETEFIYGELKEEIQKKVNVKCKGRNMEFKKEAVQYVIDTISRRIERGFIFTSFEYNITCIISRFYREYKQQYQTVEFNERIM